MVADTVSGDAKVAGHVVAGAINKTAQVVHKALPKWFGNASVAAASAVAKGVDAATDAASHAVQSAGETVSHEVEVAGVHVENKTRARRGNAIRSGANVTTGKLEKNSGYQLDHNLRK